MAVTKLHTIDFVSLLLVIIGALNWGLVGLFGFNVVTAMFGEMTALARIVYILVGLAAVYTAVRSPSMAHLHFGHRPHAA